MSRKRNSFNNKERIQRMLMEKQHNQCYLCCNEMALTRDLIPLGWVIGGYKRMYLLSPDRTKKVAIATIEHVIPVSQGGTNAQSNLVMFCARCNWTTS